MNARWLHFSMCALLGLTPDRRIPADVLSKACGIVLLDRTKAGFGFAYQGGGGKRARKDGFGVLPEIAVLQRSAPVPGLSLPTSF
jgi:lipid-binding SYLF domain-containing protein